jgi:hypothetical protein
MGIHEIFPCLDLIKIFTDTDWLRGVPDITWPAIPIFTDLLNSRIHEALPKAI